MPDRPAQRRSINALQDHRGKADCAYLDSTQRRASAVSRSKALSSRGLRLLQGRNKLAADDRRLRIVQLLLKSPTLVRLIELCVQQSEAHVCECGDPSDQQEAADPTNKALASCRQKQWPPNSEYHDRSPWRLRMETLRSNRCGCGLINVHDLARLLSPV